MCRWGHRQRGRDSNASAGGAGGGECGGIHAGDRSGADFEQEELTAAEIIDIPYPGAHDYRNGLIFIPGVTPDAYGQPHVPARDLPNSAFAGRLQRDPTDQRQLVVRTSVESFRSIEVAASREPAEFGKGSGGVLALNTRMGDDHFRITSTDFMPGVQDVKGISIGQWPPIYTVSGPIHKGKAWYIDALDGEYDNTIIKQLPGLRYRSRWRVDNLAKLQSKLTTHNIVTASFLSNYYHDQYDGLSVATSANNSD